MMNREGPFGPSIRSGRRGLRHADRRWLAGVGERAITTMTSEACPSARALLVPGRFARAAKYEWRIGGFHLDRGGEFATSERSHGRPHPESSRMALCLGKWGLKGTWFGVEEFSPPGLPSSASLARLAATSRHPSSRPSPNPPPTTTSSSNAGLAPSERLLSLSNLRLGDKGTPEEPSRTPRQQICGRFARTPQRFI